MRKKRVTIAEKILNEYIIYGGFPFKRKDVASNLKNHGFNPYDAFAPGWETVDDPDKWCMERLNRTYKEIYPEIKSIIEE